MTLNNNIRPEDLDNIVDAESSSLGEGKTDDIHSFAASYSTTQVQEQPYTSRNLNLNLDFFPGFQPSTDWLSPSPSWTSNRTPSTDFDSGLPSSASGIYQDPNWNPFDFSAQTLNGTITNGAFVFRSPFESGTSGSSTYQQGFHDSDNSSYVNLRSINPSTEIDTQHFDYNHEPQHQLQSQPTFSSPFLSPGLAPGAQSQSQPQPTFTSPFPSPGLAPGPQTRARQPARGQSRSRGTSSSTSSRSHQQQQKRKSTSSAPPIRLRSTSSSTQAGTFSTMPSNSKSEDSKTRSNHNQIEKQYRNRLNSQFETLLAALPKEEGRLGEGGEEERKVSKSEALDMAQRHIRKLEMEGEELQEENRGLKGRVEELNRLWVEGGGIVMP